MLSIIVNFKGNGISESNLIPGQEVSFISLNTYALGKSIAPFVLSPLLWVNRRADLFC